MEDGLKIILEESFSIELNANDFFGYACAMSVSLDALDLEWAIPFVAENPVYGVRAIMCYIQNSLPIKPHRSSGLKNALKSLKKLSPKLNSDNDWQDN